MRWIRTNRLLTGGLAVAVVGLVLLAVAALIPQPGTQSFGWFAYAPPAVTTVLPGPTVGQVFGTLLSGIGLILIAGALGYYAARRRG